MHPFEVYENLLEEDPKPQREVCRSVRRYFMGGVLAFLLLVLVTAMAWLTVSTPADASTDATVLPSPPPAGPLYVGVLNPSDIWESYPRYAGRQQLFDINFNMTLMQANYVYYLITGNVNISIISSAYFTDPYGYCTIDPMEYEYSGYSRVRLASGRSVGNDSYTMANVVPLLPSFATTWGNIETDLIKNFPGKLVYKGCRYNSTTFTAGTGRPIYLPLGCYYVVLDTSDLFAGGGRLLDYGYYPNSNTSKLTDKQKLLPYWITAM